MPPCSLSDLPVMYYTLYEHTPLTLQSTECGSVSGDRTLGLDTAGRGVYCVKHQTVPIIRPLRVKLTDLH